MGELNKAFRKVMRVMIIWAILTGVGLAVAVSYEEIQSYKKYKQAVLEIETKSIQVSK